MHRKNSGISGRLLSFRQKVASSHYDLWRPENFTQSNLEDNKLREFCKEQDVWLNICISKVAILLYSRKQLENV